MNVNWDSAGMCLWKEETVKEQQGYFDLIGRHKYRILEQSDYNNLQRKLGFALFGLPEKEPDEKLNDNTGYEKKQVEQIKKILNLIKNCIDKNEKNSWINILFVSGKVGDDYMRYPVIRITEHNVALKQKNYIFIDSRGRVYKSWQDYLENNTLPACVICYPKNGVYTAVIDVVEVEFGISAAGQIGRRLLQAFDIGGIVAGIGASGVGVAALCVPVAWPVVAGAVGMSVLTGGYTAGRSIQTLVDRSQHKQTLGLNSREARNCWLGIAGSFMSFAAGGTVTFAARLAQRGSRVTLATQIAVKSVTIGSCTLNALGVTSGLAQIITKVVNKEKITALEIFQFTSVVLFFTNSVVLAHQAQSMLKGIAESGTGESLGSTKSSIFQLSEFMKQNVLCKGIAPFVSGCSGCASDNPRGTFFVFCQWLSRKLIQITASLKKGLINTLGYMVKIREFLYSFWENWNEEMTEVANKICRALGIKISLKSGHTTEMASILIAERSRLAKLGITVKPSQQGKVMSDNDVMGTASYNNDEPNNFVEEERNTSVSYDDDAETSVSSYDDDTQTSVSSCDDDTQTSLSYDDEVIHMLAKFVDGEICRNPADYSRYMMFVCKFVTNRFEEEKSNYEKTWEMVQKFNPNVSVEEFKKGYGISGNENNHFFQEVFKKFKNEEKDEFTLLKLAYHSENADKSSKDQRRQSSIVMDGVTFHPFHNWLGRAGSEMQSKEWYCDMAAELTGQYVHTDNIHVSARGDTAFIQVNDGEYVVMVQSMLKDGKVSGVAIVLHNPKECLWRLNCNRQQ